MLLSFLQTELLSLSSEASKRKNELPIKEASERLLFNLREIKETNKDISVELSKSMDTLKPFMLSFESKNPKLISISIGCFQKLISHNATPPSSLVQILNCLSGIDSNALDLQLKTLQILLPFLVHGELLASCLLLCYKHSINTKQPILANTASATFRQIAIQVFEKLDKMETKENITVNSEEFHDLGNESNSLQSLHASYEKDDLCNLYVGDQGSFLKVTSMSKTVSLEIIETIITTSPGLFLKHSKMITILREKVISALQSQVSEKTEFSLMVRIVRIVKVVLKHFSTKTPVELEILISNFIEILNGTTHPPWQRILVLECFKSILSEPGLQITIFENFDKNEGFKNLYQDICIASLNVILEAKTYLLFYNPQSNQSTEDGFSLSIKNGSIRISCIEQLEKEEPPTCPQAYPIYLGYQCLCSIVDNHLDLINPLSKEMDIQESGGILMAIEMAKCNLLLVYYSLSLLLVSSVEEVIFTKTLDLFKKSIKVSGVLGLFSYRDAFIGTLCRVSLTSQLPNINFDNIQPHKEIEPFNFGLIGKLVSAMISDRNLTILSCVLESSLEIMDVMDSKSWFAVLDTLSMVESMFSPKSQFRRMDSLTATEETIKREHTSRNKSNIGSSSLSASPFLENYSVKYSPPINEFQKESSTGYLAFSKQIFESSVNMKSRSFMEFIRALCRLAQESISTQSNQQTKEKINDEKSYGISKLHEICLLNIKRMVGPDEIVFQLVSNQLVNFAHTPNVSSSARNQACNVFGEIIINATQEPEFQNEEKIEERIIDSLRLLMAFEPKPADDILVPESDSSINKIPFLFEVRKNGLEIIHKLLERSGQYIKKGWLALLEIIFFVVQSGNKKKIEKSVDGTLSLQIYVNSAVVTEASVIPNTAITTTPASMDFPGTSNSKTSNLVRVGFPSVQLICTDFLSNLSSIGISRCIQTVAAFGTFAEDLNISLTSVGLLWSICDFILTKRSDFEKNEAKKEGDTSPIKKGSLMDLSLIASSDQMTTMDALWMYLLQNLSELCSDYRPEVRNSANQTLFRTINMNASRLDSDAWDMCLSNVLFPLLERIQKSSQSSDKSWDETKILTINGVIKCFYDSMIILVELGDKFKSDWETLLDYIKKTCLNSSHEVSIACFKSLKTLFAYTTKETITEDILNQLKPYWWHGYKVWIDIGEEITVMATTQIEIAAPKPIVVWSDGNYPFLFAGYFTQEILSVYFSLFSELLSTINDLVKFEDYKKTVYLLQRLLLYQTKPLPSATNTRMRIDIVNDLDNLTQCQAQFLDILLGEKIPYKFTQNFENVVIDILSDMIQAPFIPFEYDDEAPIYVVDSNVKKHSFIALSKKSIEIVLKKFEKDSLDLYKSGSFINTLKSLRVSLNYKYSCPQTSSRDPIPLWKVSFKCAKSLVSSSFFVLGDDNDMDEKTTKSNLQAILDILSVMLLSSSKSPHPPDTEEFTNDRDLELEILKLIEQDALVFFGRPSLDKNFILNLLEILDNLASNNLLPEPVPIKFATSMNHLNSSSNLFSPTQTPNILPSKPTEVEPLDIGPGGEVPQKEKQSYAALDVLFLICSDTTPGTDSDLRVASYAFPVLINRCKSIIEKYISDHEIVGLFPMPRHRKHELGLVLTSLLHLQLRQKEFTLNQDDIEDQVTRYLLNSPSAHLFILYPQLCDLLSDLSKYSKMSADNIYLATEECSMTDLVMSCLKRIGIIFPSLKSLKNAENS